MFDYHIHPDFSIDATGTVDDYCRTALEKGLSEICFTTHLDTFRRREDCHVMVDGRRVPTVTGDWLNIYEQTVRNASEIYRPHGLEVLLGVEVDYFDDVESSLPQQFYDMKFDLVIGSVHILDGLAISTESEAREIFDKYTVAELAEAYFGIVLDCIRSQLFDVIGHLDLYRRFGTRSYGNELNDAWRDHIAHVIRAMRDGHVVPEINTESLRRGDREPMPSSDIIAALVAGGIRDFTVGSDAHRPQDAGRHIEVAERILRDNNVDGPVRFRNRRIIRDARPQQRLSDRTGSR